LSGQPSRQPRWLNIALGFGDMATDMSRGLRYFNLGPLCARSGHSREVSFWAESDIALIAAY
jgi:hypothetical protein